MDIDAQLVANNLAYIQQHALAVDTLDFDGCIEEYLLCAYPIWHPRCGCRNWTSVWLLAEGVCVFDAVLVVDKAHNVIAWNRMAAAAREDKLVDVLLCQDEWLLLVEVLATTKDPEVSRSLFLSLLLALPRNGYNCASLLFLVLP